MNRVHRVVWSESRQAFIVTSERAKARGKPSSTRKAIASAVMMALAAMAAPSVFAAPCPAAAGGVISVSTAGVTATCNLGAGESLTVTNTGQIAAEPAVTVNGVAATGIDNSGDILAFATGIDIYGAGSLTGAITNNTGGRISGANFGIHIVNGSSVSGGITNAAGGSITGGGAIALLTGSSVSGGISNLGSVIGGSYGIGLNASTLTGGIVNSGSIIQGQRGIYLVSNSSADSITNQAGGTISGTVDGITIKASSVTGDINNGGTISGTSGSNAIHLSSGGTAGSITNSGTIAGNNNGIYLNQSSSVTGAITNNAAGSITSSTGGSGVGILLSANSTAGSIVNAGTISGARAGIRLTDVGTPTGNLGGSSVTGNISNTGTITGSSAGILLSSGSTAGGIVNSGTISSNNTVISIRSGSSITGSITNNVGGTIIGRTGTGTGTGTGIYLASSTIGGNIVNSGTITGGIALANISTVTGSITNNSGGTISRNGSSSAAISLSGGSTAGSITNSGSITANGYGIRLTSSSSVTGAITNNAGGTISGASSNGIYLSSGSSAGSISNSGTISGRNGAIWIGNSTVGSITNNAGGTISSTGQTGLRITNAGSITGNITNNGTISGINTGLYISNGSNVGGNIANSGMVSAHWAGISITNAAVAGSIANSAGGTIRGIATNTGSAGHGISLSHATVGSISNSGTIQGVAGSAAQPGIGIRVANTSTVTGAITNNTGGTISGGRTGILVDAGSTAGSISNAGTITGSSGSAINILGTVTGGITNTGTINGAVALNGATLNLNGSAGSITGAVTGGAGSSVNVNGTFTTANTFAVDNFAIANGGVLNMGHGITPTTAFSNAGTLVVAAGTTATITGNYTQSATGVFRTRVTDDTTYGKLVVTGTATLPANAKIDVNVANPNFAFTATDMAGIITAGSLVSDGTFAVTDNSVLFDFTATKNGNAVDLALAAAGGGGGGSGSVVSAVTATGNTSATGAATVLDGLVTAFAGGGTGDADMDTVIAALGTLTTEQEVSDAVSQTLPLMSGGMSQATANNLNGANQAIQAHQEETGLSSGDGFANRQGWIKPLGSWADQKDRNGAFGYGAQTYGVVLGADGELSQASNVGAAFAYTHSSVDSNSGAQSAGVDSYQIVLYGANSLDERTELNWQADYGYNRNKGSRAIAFVNRVAAANYTSDSFHVGAGIGRTLAMNEQTSFTPSLHADYTSITDQGYTETGAGALNLVVNGKTTDQFILAVDGKVAHKLSEANTLTANLGAGYDANAKQNSITASFAGGGAAFTTAGINPGSTVVRGGLGFVSNTAGGMEITARYDIETRAGFTGQTASVKMRMPF
jgi:uncharacterized protein with beta-barrel porin domain